MRGDPETRVQFAALLVSLQARFKQLPDDDVEQLRAFARSTLIEGNPTLAAIEEFSLRWRVVRRQPDEREDLGRELHDHLVRLSRRDPPGMDRSDIYG